MSEIGLLNTNAIIISAIQLKTRKKEYFEANKLFIQVLEGLHTWKKDGELLSVIEIKKALAKGRE